MGPFDYEGDDPPKLIGFAEETETWDLPKEKARFLGEMVLPGADLLSAYGFDPVEGRAEPNHLSDRRRARFEPKGRLLERSPRVGHLFDHVSPKLVGGHLGEEFVFPIENADSGRSKGFVPRKCIKIGAEGYDIYGQMGGCLRSVDEELSSYFGGELFYFPDRVDRSGDVRHVAKSDELGAGGERASSWSRRRFPFSSIGQIRKIAPFLCKAAATESDWRGAPSR